MVLLARPLSVKVVAPGPTRATSAKVPPPGRRSIEKLDSLLLWSFQVTRARRGEPGAIPLITRGGTNRNNGVWFRAGQMFAQNEETAHLPDKVERHSFAELLTIAEPPPRSPEESLASIRVRPGFKVELVASEPLVVDPVAFDWGPDGKFWVVEMRDYPLGIPDSTAASGARSDRESGPGAASHAAGYKPGGVIKFFRGRHRRRWQSGRAEAAPRRVQ